MENKCELKYCVNFQYDDDYIGEEHAHPCYELVYYVKGNGVVRINNKDFIFKEGDFSFINQHDLHLEKGNKDTEVLYIGFTAKSKNIMITNGIYQDSFGSVLSLLKEIYKEMKNQRPYYSEIMNMLCETILLNVDRIVNLNNSDKGRGLEYVVKYIKMNCMKKITVNGLAEEIGYSTDYFRHLFKKTFSINAKDFILKEKLNYAVDLLVTKDLSIKEISYYSGFCSPSHFTKIFKQFYNCTPKEFIAQKDKKDKHNEIIYNKDDVIFVQSNSK